MTIASISGIGSFQPSQGVSNASAKLQEVIAGIVSGQSSDVADLSIATTLQSQTTGLRQAASNLAQASSFLGVADGAASQLADIAQQMRALAQQASSSTLSTSDRTNLTTQFRQFAAEYNRLSDSASFNGQKLLDGSLSGDNALSVDKILGGSGSGGATLSIGDLSSSNLLSDVDLLSADNAAQALTAVNTALTEIIGTRAAIGSFQQALGFAEANVATALVNQEAARSFLSETDLAEASSRKAQSEVQRNATIALAAQGNKLPAGLLKLVG